MKVLVTGLQDVMKALLTGVLLGGAMVVIPARICIAVAGASIGSDNTGLCQRA